MSDEGIKKVIEIEAESLEEARKQANLQIPEGECLLSEKVISDGNPQTTNAVADTSEEALKKARSQVPTNANVLDTKVVTTPRSSTVTVEAFDESIARSQVMSQIENTAIIQTLNMTISGKKGILGIGKRPAQWEAKVFQPAIAEVTYQAKARISVEIGKDSIVQLCCICARGISVSEYKNSLMSGVVISAQGPISDETMLNFVKSLGAVLECSVCHGLICSECVTKRSSLQHGESLGLTCVGAFQAMKL